MPASSAVPESLRADVEVLWDYHRIDHPLAVCDVAVGLGSHDLDVATHTAELYHRGLSERIVFTGANAPTTADRFPRGEAPHYRDHAVDLGVPETAIIVEPDATNTAENIQYTRQALIENRVRARSVLLVSRPYQQRRAFATCKKLWPEVEVTCTSRPVPFEEYAERIGDVHHVINMLVGDTQRVTLYAERGFAIPQPVPAEVSRAYEALVAAGYTRRLIDD